MRNPLLNFEDVLRGVNALAEGTHEDPTTQDYPRYRAFLDLALAEAWNSEWWPDLMRIEERYFRANYASGTSYDKTDEVYYPLTQKYYQALRNAMSAQAPATGDPLAENSAYWAESKSTYNGANWVTATSYVVGDKVFYPVTNRYYQCHTAHTSSGTLVPDATGANERWGVLTPFNRYIDWAQTGQTAIGDVFDVKNADPRMTQRWRSLIHGISNDGVQVAEAASWCYVQFRLRRPILKGALYASTSSYAVGDQVYFAPAGGKGNLYNCISSASAGESPSASAAKWDLVEIPQMFENYLVWSAYAKHLASEGKHSSVAGAKAMAEEYLALETDRIYRQSGQTPPLPITPYPSTGSL